MAKGVLLLQMGGPCCTSNIQNFLFNLFNDKYIIQLPSFLQPFQKDLAEFISSRRAPSVAENYEMIGGRSPILFESLCQARALEKKLNKESDEEYKCYLAMRYSYPFLKDAIKDMKRDGIEELTVVPLYPQYSLATTGSSIIECKELFAQEDFLKNVTYIESWEDHPSFIELICQRLTTRLEELEIKIKRKELELQKQAEYSENTSSTYFNKEINILFSAHGLPVKYIANGDPYQRQVEDSVSLVVQKLAEKLGLKAYQNKLISDRLKIKWQITFQSRVGPVKWLEPNTEDVLEELGENGAKNVIIVPIAFVGDHIETLHELGIEYAEVAEEFGIENYLITRLPKANPLLIQALFDQVIRATRVKINNNESSNLQSQDTRDSISQ